MSRIAPSSWPHPPRPPRPPSEQPQPRPWSAKPPLPPPSPSISGRRRRRKMSARRRLRSAVPTGRTASTVGDWKESEFGYESGSGISQSRSTNDLQTGGAVESPDFLRPTSRERRAERRLLAGYGQLTDGEVSRSPLQHRQPRRQQLGARPPPPQPTQLPPPSPLALDVQPLAIGELEIRTTQSLILQRREAAQRSFVYGCLGAPGAPSRQSSFGSTASDVPSEHQLDSSGSFCYSQTNGSSSSGLSRRSQLMSYSGLGFPQQGSGQQNRQRASGPGGSGVMSPGPYSEKYRFSDPSTGALGIFSQRLSELTSLVADTVRFERGKTGKSKKK